MRELIIQFNGDNWDDESEAEKVEQSVQDALDAAAIDYVDLHVK